MSKYDYLIVGAGLYGAACARELTDAGKKCLVIEKRDHVAGNCYTREIEGIQVHVYGGHIFHTRIERVWKYVNRFAKFNNFVNSPIANYHGTLYNLPFNMNTFYQMWGVTTPDAARREIARQVKEAGITEPSNFAEQAIALVGCDIYEKLVKGYTEKQWGRACADLPAFIIKRLPVRFTFDNNYFNDPHQGVPIGGYTAMVQKMLAGIEVRLNTDYLMNKSSFDVVASRVIYTGPIDQYFNYCCGALEWRSLRFETEVLKIDNFQGVAAVNYTDNETPYTRILEHKHFEFGKQDKTVITKEYPQPCVNGVEAYYPVNDETNQKLYKKYTTLAEKELNVKFGGRLGTYCYYDMDKVVDTALACCTNILKG